MLEFGRGLCSDEAQAAQREWLVTNGIGGYASGTIGGLLTRHYHGLLVAALEPPLKRTLLLTRLEETAWYDERIYRLAANRWTDDSIEPAGFRHLERFHLEGTTPVWTFACADALLQKRIWMQQEANTTYVKYTLLRGSLPLSLELRSLVNYRTYHGSTHAGGWEMQVVPVAHGLRVDPFFGAASTYLLCASASATPQHTWHNNFLLSVEQQRGLEPHDDHLCVGSFQAVLQPGASLTFVASTEADPALDGEAAYQQHQAAEQQVLARSQQAAQASPWIQQLTLAANQFLVCRASQDDPQGKTIIAGYHWFSDWGRDTMISLPGLTLATGQSDVAARILRTFARFVQQGMIPNRFPDAGEEPEYNTVDATLWYIEAIRAYHATTGDTTLVKELFPVLEKIITWHQQGTRYHIQVDPADGLLYAGEPGVQLTWMDAMVDDWVVTPRIGKAIEVNALWYNALCSVAEFARLLGVSPASYEAAASSVRASFPRFWNEETGYCYDVLDGPEGHEAALRPNQVIAAALPYTPLDARQQKAAVDSSARCLLTSYGLRSLAPAEPDYIGFYGGSPRQRDASYHQGTVWAWLIGSFVLAHLRVYNNPVLARSFLQPFAQHISDAGVGSISEIFDGDAPFAPRGCIAQAWSVAEVLRAWHHLNQAEL